MKEIKTFSMTTRKRPAPASDVPKPPARTVLDGLPFDPKDVALPRGLRLFGAHLARVQKILATRGSEDTPRGHTLYRADLRTPLFMLEALSRVAVGTMDDDETFEKLLGEVKIIEDSIGEVDFWWTLASKAPGWNLPPAFTEYASKHHLAASGRLVGWLEARDWVDHRYLPQEGEVRLRVHRIGRNLQKASWPSLPRERKKLAGFLHDKLLATDRAAHALDLSNVEHGLHELRRRLRWVSIYAAALGGAIQLDPAARAPKGWKRYLTEAVVKNPFNALPQGDGHITPILLPAPLFYALSWLIAELGALKDRAQWTESVDHGLKVVGVTMDRPLGDLTLDATEAGARARALAERTIFEDKLLTRLADAVEAQAT